MAGGLRPGHFGMEGNMAKKNRRSKKLLIGVLLAALLAVVGIILWKQWEYAAGDDFYGGLRGAMWLGGVLL